MAAAGEEAEVIKLNNDLVRAAGASTYLAMQRFPPTVMIHQCKNHHCSPPPAPL